MLYIDTYIDRYIHMCINKHVCKLNTVIVTVKKTVWEWMLRGQHREGLSKDMA